MKTKIDTSPKAVFEEYKAGTDFKASVGDKGIFEQSKINERFYVGDHWHGVQCGNDRPLVRRNIIKRIADYKLSSIGAAPIAVNFSAEGIPENVIDENERKMVYDGITAGNDGFSGDVDGIEASVMMQILGDYASTTMERIGFSVLSADALKNAYLSGTGILYTYWDELVNTGLYVDSAKQTPIMGDIACEVVDIENVVFGDPNCDSVQNQPYIIISQRKMAEDVKREARRNKRPQEDIDNIKPDDADHLKANAGTRGMEEPQNSSRVTVLTKFYKEWDDEGKQYKVMCVRCTEKSMVREPWDIGIRLYPISKLVWDRRRSSSYGDSEVTYLIPNQIAINRALSAEVWGCMLTGMPIMLKNSDVIQVPITNDPGQIIEVLAGDTFALNNALQYIQPPAFAEQMITSINDLANNTLSDSGANDAALGNVRPDNAAAIIQMREAALQPMQLKQNQYYAFIEDTARIWAEFWLHLYGDRQLKILTDKGAAYVPFHASRYSKLLVNAKVDVGAATLWSTSVVVSTLDALLTAQIITPTQYLERLPDGLIPNKTGLIEDLKMQQQEIETANEELSDSSVLNEFANQNPELFAQFEKLPPEQQQAMLQRMRGNAGGNTDDGV